MTTLDILQLLLRFQDRFKTVSVIAKDVAFIPVLPLSCVERRPGVYTFALSDKPLAALPPSTFQSELAGHKFALLAHENRCLPMQLDHCGLWKSDVPDFWVDVMKDRLG